jgi:hypothetical protein
MAATITDGGVRGMGTMGIVEQEEVAVLIGKKLVLRWWMSSG